jgi:hypothetical protein
MTASNAAPHPARGARIHAAIAACPAGRAVKLAAVSAGENAFLSGPLALTGSDGRDGPSAER